MENWKLPLYKIYSDDEDLQLVSNIIKRGTDWAIGPEIEEFEQLIKNFMDSKYCVTFNSGTSALHAALLAYGVSKFDEVIVPSFSFIATVNCVLFVDATPKFSDIEETTFGLDPSLIEKKISNNTKAIIPMDYGGMSCNIPEIQKIARDHNLILLEDAAECLGSTINGSKVGSLSDSAIFSFCGNKVITTGEGGAIVTDSPKIFEKLKLIRSHGRADSSTYFDNTSTSSYSELGYNWRMSSITAALGIAQMKKLKKIISMRQENAKYISSRLTKHPQISVPKTPSGYEHIYQMYTIRLSDEKVRDSLQQFLKERRIFSKVYFFPIHLTSFYKSRSDHLESLPVTEKVSREILTLPMYPNMTAEEKDFLIDTIDEFFEKFTTN